MINAINKLKQSDSPSLGEGGERLSLLELNALVRRSLEQCLPDEYWIQAELSDVRSNTTGHCYLEFVQKDPRSNNLVAKPCSLNMGVAKTSMTCLLSRLNKIDST